jgi:hypothetical protein
VLLTLEATTVAPVAEVPTYTSYPVAPPALFHDNVTELVVTKLPFAGAALVVHPGVDGGGGGGGVFPPFFPHE